MKMPAPGEELYRGTDPHTLREVLALACSIYHPAWPDFVRINPEVRSPTCPSELAESLTADMLQMLDDVSPVGCVFTVIDNVYGWHRAMAVQPSTGGIKNVQFEAIEGTTAGRHDHRSDRVVV